MRKKRGATATSPTGGEPASIRDEKHRERPEAANNAEVREFPKARDARDLFDFLACLALAAGGWLLLGWRPTHQISGHDGVIQAYPYLEELARVGGDWTRLLYRASIQGGFEIHDVVGTGVFRALLLRLGFGTLHAQNLGTLLYHALAGFLLARVAADLAALWRAPLPREWLSRVPRFILCLFTPFFAWRLSYGHEEILNGGLVAVAALSQGLAVAARTTTASHAAIAFLVYWQAFAVLAYQTVFYGFVFGLPAFLLTAWAGGWRAAALPALTGLAALVADLGHFHAMLARASGPDAARSIGGANVIFSYIQSEARDLAGSLTWALERIPSGRPFDQLHETNSPLGATALAVLLALGAGLAGAWRNFHATPDRREKLARLGSALRPNQPLAWALALVLSFALAWGFSADFAPLSRGLPALIPPLKSFRVPQRALFTFLFLAPAFAAAWLGNAGAVPRAKGAAALAAGMLVAAVLPPALREGVAVATAIALAVGRAVPIPALASAALLALLAGASVGAFGDRVLPFSPTAQAAQEGRRLGDQLKASFPELAAPLSRANVDLELPGMGPNTAWVIGLNTLNGYWSPSRRFSELVAALDGREFNPTVCYFKFSENAPGYSALRRIYHAPFRITGRPAPGGGVEPVVEKTAETLGPAWFSDGARALADMVAVASEIRVAELPALRGTQLVATSDPAFGAAPEVGRLGCAGAEIRAVRADGETIAIDTQVPGACAFAALTVSTNFSSALEARGWDAQGRESRLSTYPAYGALLGIALPKEVTRIVIAPRPPPGWVGFAPWAGLAILLTALAWARRLPSARISH